jgi:hypothetical protein
MKAPRGFPAVVLVAMTMTSLWAVAAVSPEEAGKLRSELTPLGAERAGNAQGTIPAWTGGYTTVWPGYRSGQPRPDPFADEKPRLQIAANNMAQYSDKLSEGVQALLKRFPTYRLDVYPTHRTASAPPWVYDNTYRNASRATTAHGGISVQGAYGGIPFPIPHDGNEAMWNHQLAWKGEAFRYDYSTYVVIGKKPAMSTSATLDTQYPYYYRDGSLDRFGGTHFLVRNSTTGPPLRAGELTVAQEPVDHYSDHRKAWQYLVGQRRVRRAPELNYDFPSFISSGFSFLDETYLFNGPMDRYTWKLVGKREMFVPYNTNGFFRQRFDQVLGPDHLNPDHLRWELHRVWVVEATLAPGKRHVMPKRRFYLDEDTWQALLADSWDASGQLWHTGYSLTVIAPEYPGLISAPYVIHDLVKRGYVASSLFNERQRHYEAMPRRAEDYFSPAALAGEGVR